MTPLRSVGRLFRRFVVGLGALLLGWGGLGFVPSSIAALDFPATLDFGTPPPPGSVNGVAPIPEPASWALMILGMILMGAALRHRPARRRSGSRG